MQLYFTKELTCVMYDMSISIEEPELIYKKCYFNKCKDENEQY